MSLKLSIAAALATGTLLSACSSAPVAELAPRPGNTDSAKVLASEAGSAANALSNGHTLTASQRSSSGIFRLRDQDGAILLEDSSAQITLTDNGGIDFVVGGHTFHFTADELTADGYGYEQDGAALSAWSAESMAEQLLPENTHYSLVFGYWYALSDTDGADGFAVVGTETEDAVLAALPSATYTGWAWLNMAPAEGFTSWDDAVQSVNGDLSMQADFGAGTVSGAVTGMKWQDTRNNDPARTWNPIDGTVTLETTQIAGNGFTGVMTADADLAAEIGGSFAGDATYSGTFYGPNGEEVAGGFNLTGILNGTDYLGWGAFQGTQD